MKRKPQLPPEWSEYTQARRKRYRSAPSWAYAATGLGLGSIIGLAIFLWPSGTPAEASGPQTAAQASAWRTFSFCHTGGGTNCVVDGDTIWVDGVKIRVADIDAPETHPPRCEREADLGDRATQRLLQLVNVGPFEAVRAGSRDEDGYGRKLRVLERDGVSLGGVLVSEGLARPWGGAREPWC